MCVCERERERERVRECVRERERVSERVRERERVRASERERCFHPHKAEKISVKQAIGFINHNITIVQEVEDNSLESIQIHV